MSENISLRIWNAFNSKIKSDWGKKYSCYGTFENRTQKIKLCESIYEEIDKELNKQQDRRVKVFSAKTLYGYYQKKNEDISFKPNTIDIFLWYLGFENITEFKESSAFTGIEKEVSDKENVDSSTIGLKVIVLILPLAMVLGLILYLMVQVPRASNKVESKFIESVDEVAIRHLIDKASNFEYYLYSQIPNLSDTVILDTYFTHDGIGKRTIIKTLFKTIEKNRVLHKERSSQVHNKYDFEISNIRKDSASVHTIEYWKLIWLDRRTLKKKHVYENINKQEYQVVRKLGKWYIENNIYSGSVEYSQE